MTIAAEATVSADLTSAPTEALQGEIHVPGDKSMSHRALILGGLARGETRISGLLEGDDVLHTGPLLNGFDLGVKRGQHDGDDYAAFLQRVFQLGFGVLRVQGNSNATRFPPVAR